MRSGKFCCCLYLWDGSCLSSTQY